MQITEMEPIEVWNSPINEYQRIVAGLFEHIHDGEGNWHPVMIKH
jgi:hypothetical protein